MRLFRSRAFSAANGASLFMYFGMFGSIFLLTQFFQTAQGYSPLEAGPARPAVDGDADGRRPDRRRALRPDRRQAVHGARARAAGVGLAWIAAVSDATVGYASLVGPFVLSGIGMGMFFAPVANVVLSAVRPQEEGKASGANNAIREVGACWRRRARLDLHALWRVHVAETFTDGLVVATWVGAVVVGAGALVALLIPRKRRAGESPSSRPSMPQLEAA